MGKRKIIISCEHAGYYIPKEYEYLFSGQEEVLLSHRGWDIGALGVAKYLARHLEAPLHVQKASRLLVEANRSIDNPELFSPFSAKLDKSIKKYLLNKYYYPYRNDVEEKIGKYISEGHEVLHLSIHSFTPNLNNIERQVDVGILFDDRLQTEATISKKLQMQLQVLLPELAIFFNVPYSGSDDGFTTYLRTRFKENYIGLELEINQKYVNTETLREIRTALLTSLDMIGVVEEKQVDV